MTVAIHHPEISAELQGVDMARPLDEATFRAVHAAWMERLGAGVPRPAHLPTNNVAFTLFR